MRTLATGLAAVAIAAGFAIPFAVKAQTPVDPVTEQISFISLHDCFERAYDEYPPPCSRSVLMDPDGSHVIPDMPVGAWSPDGSKVLVATALEEGQALDIYITEPGAALRNLTNHPAGDAWAAWSPDGTRIAFASNRDGALGLYVMNADGTNTVKIEIGAIEVTSAYFPMWSPDGARFAFMCVIGDNLEICAVNVDGSQFARLTSDPAGDWEPSWSPDGTKILFVSTRPNYDTPELFTMNPDGSNVVRVSPGLLADSPRLSPDGSRIVFVDINLFVSVINWDGTGLTTLGWGYAPRWRPWTGGVDDRPVAGFTFECIELTCTFDGSPSTDRDGTITKYLWQFDDGTTASGVTATHTFASGDVYELRLIVTDDRGALGISTQFLNMNLPPDVSFTATCKGLACTFDAMATFDPDGTISAFRWDFGDAIDPYGAATTAHYYASSGTYIVTLTASDNANMTGTFTWTVEVVNLPPTASLTFACSFLTCRFDASGSVDGDGVVTSYLWSFGDGTTGTGVAPTHSYAAAGTYAVTLTVTDNAAATSTQTRTVIAVRPDMHIGDLDGSSTTHANTWTAMVAIEVHDIAHAPIANSTVSAVWSDGIPASCITDVSGRCVVSRPGIWRKTKVSLTVTAAAHSALVYTPASNHDSDNDSDGTTIRLQRQ